MKVVLAIIIFLILLCMMKLSITIFFQHAQDDDECRITIKALFGLIRYTIRIPLIKVEVDTQSVGIVVSHQETLKNTFESPPKRKKYSPREIMHSFKKAREFTRHVVRLYEIVKKFLSHVSITKLEWQTKLGTGDAAYTGMAVGLGWSLKYGMVALFSKYMKLKTMPVLAITPCFQHAVSETKFVCMIHFRIGHAMLAGIRIVKYWRGNHLSEIKSLATHQANERY